MTNSFEFPGYQKTDATYSPNYEFERGVLAIGEAKVFLKLMRATQPADLPWLVTSVSDKDNKTLWAYDKTSMVGYGRLADTTHGPVVAFLGNGKSGKVLRVTTFSELFGQPSSVEEKLDAKRQAGKFLDREVEESETEKKILRRFIEQRREQNNAEKEAERLAKEEVRRQRRATILARPKISGFTKDGSKRYGHPVVGDEWQSLFDGTFVILVSALDGDMVGDLVESFIVNKTPGGNPRKLNIAPVSATPPAVPNRQTMIPQPTDEVYIETEKGTFAVKLYPSMEDIRAARKAGLNGGTYVAVKPAVPGKIEVLAVHHDRVDTIGKFETINL